MGEELGDSWGAPEGRLGGAPWLGQGLFPAGEAGTQGSWGVRARQQHL